MILPLLFRSVFYLSYFVTYCRFDKSRFRVYGPTSRKYRFGVQQHRFRNACEYTWREDVRTDTGGCRVSRFTVVGTKWRELFGNGSSLNRRRRNEKRKHGYYRTVQHPSPTPTARDSAERRSDPVGRGRNRPFYGAHTRRTTLCRTHFLTSIPAFNGPRSAAGERVPCANGYLNGRRRTFSRRHCCLDRHRVHANKSTVVGDFARKHGRPASITFKASERLRQRWRLVPTVAAAYGRNV